MTNEDYQEDPLEKLMDGESDEEFGLPEIRDRMYHHADENVDGNLKDWSAQDFASIYVRFRPHLERHARRYLNNTIQAEEVVQDAFLYLMTTLPELDSELGVLKFLKWKIRLLSLDVIRASSNRREQPVPEHMELPSDDAEISADLERAEDSAIIRLALAKLNPRHREALIATVYEEKPAEVVAKQLGLSENAFRQLLFRARSAFKKALVGEVDTAGLSMGQLLSVATKKAAFDAKQNAAAVGGFLVLAAISIGLLPNLLSTQTTVVAEAPAVESQIEQPAAPSQLPAVVESEDSSATDASASASDVESIPGSAESKEPTDSQQQQVVDVDSGASVTDADGNQQSQPAELNTETQVPQPEFTNASFSGILATDVTQAGYYTNSYASKFSDVFTGVSIEVFGGTGVSAFLDVNTNSMTIQNVVFQMWVDGERYYGVARFSEAKTEISGSGYLVQHITSDFYVVDDLGNVFSDSPLSNAEAIVRVNLDNAGNPLSASMKISR